MEELDRLRLTGRAVVEVVAGRSDLRARLLLAPEESPWALRVAEGAPAPEPGDVVVASWDGGEELEARPGEPLARAGTPRAALWRLTARHGLDPFYPQTVHDEARLLVPEAGFDDPGLEDLEHLPFVTIDNAGSRDLDQALSLERRGAGYLVWYAIADASFFVRPGSALLAEALGRGASFYLPGLTLPMLPRLLSEDLISLNQGVVRRALVFRMELDAGGVCERTDLVRARVRSRRKLSYQRVERLWDDPWGSDLRAESFASGLELLQEVGRLRLADARRRHVVDFNRQELEVRLDDDRSLGFSILGRRRLEVERCNEQVSLLCNVEGARLLEQGRGLERVQPIFRAHPEPGPERLQLLEEQVRTLVAAHDLDPERWAWRRGAGEPLADYVERLPARQRPRVRQAIDRQALLTNRRASFGEEPGGHFGIGAPVYARFSAPMREVVGVFTHKEALEMLDGPGSGSPPADDEALRDRVVSSANRARWLQDALTKGANKLVLDALFSADMRSGNRRRGTVLGFKPGHAYVLLDDPPIEVKVHLEALATVAGGEVEVDPDRVLLRRREDGAIVLRAGDALDVKASTHDESRGRWRFEVFPPTS